LTKAIVVFVICAVAFGLVGSAYAHKAEVIGDYKIEVGWKNEPPVAGVENAIEVVVTMATEHDKEMAAQESMDHEHEDHEEEMAHDEEMKHEDHEEEMAHDEEGEGVSGLANKLEIVADLAKQNTTLTLVESSTPGIYHAKYTPSVAGFLMVHMTGTIDDTNVKVTFHPEEIESPNVMPPLKQIEAGISPDHVVCKPDMELVFKPAKAGVACVKHTSVERLVDLGWIHA
jgi:hypothetical protein